MHLDYPLLAALTFSGIALLLMVLQASLAAGAPLGRLAWGGQHRVLPTALRISSGLAILVYALLSAVVLDHAGAIDWLPDAVSGVAVWVVFFYLAAAVIMNALSRSRPERFTMTPVALVLALLALTVALR